MGAEQRIRDAYQAILRGDFELATACFEDAVRLEPDCAEYRYKLSVTYARSGRWTKALEQAEAAATLEPGRDSYQGHLRQVKSRERLQAAKVWLDGPTVRAHTAVALLRQSVELDPLNAGALYWLAYAHRLTGDIGASLSAVSDLLKLEPQHEEGRRLQAELRQYWQKQWKIRKGKQKS